MKHRGEPEDDLDVHITSAEELKKLTDQVEGTASESQDPTSNLNISPISANNNANSNAQTNANSNTSNSLNTTSATQNNNNIISNTPRPNQSNISPRASLSRRSF